MRANQTGGRAISTEKDHVQDEPRPRPSRQDDDDYRRRPHYDRSYTTSQDEDHLRILSILYYVLGGLHLLGAFFVFSPALMGFWFISGGFGNMQGGGPPPEIGYFIIAFYGGLSMLLMVLVVLQLLAGYFLGKHKNYMFCFVIACLTCINVPLGTVLGIFTIIVLVRPSAKELFYGPADNPPARGGL